MISSRDCLRHDDSRFRFLRCRLCRCRSGRDCRIALYDTTLRDGAQTQGVDFGAPDKMPSPRELDRLGIDYIEGGWPGANPTDDAFFAEPAAAAPRARFTAFGMTRRAGRSAANDPGLAAVLQRGHGGAICLVGKTSDFHAELALGVTPRGKPRADRRLGRAGRERGPRGAVRCRAFLRRLSSANPDYALACLAAAHEAGARWLVLCDTNGGMLPDEIGASWRGGGDVPPERARHP